MKCPSLLYYEMVIEYFGAQTTFSESIVREILQFRTTPIQLLQVCNVFQITFFNSRVRIFLVDTSIKYTY